MLLALSAGAVPWARADKADYPQIAWTFRKELRNVRQVFCHPTRPQVAWMAAASGLMRTDDNGKTFQPVGVLSAENVGVVTSLAACPGNEDVLIVGTSTGGLVLSTDGGKTWNYMYTDSEPLAAAYVDCVRFAPDDPSFRTVIASHGVAAAGLSITRDFGQTWERIATDQYVGQFVKNGPTIVAAGSAVGTEGRIWAFYRSGTDGQRWEEANRGVRPSDVVATANRWRFLFGTHDGDIMESGNDGRTWASVLHSDRSAWVSLFFTRGAKAGERILAGYDPKRKGLVLSQSLFHHNAYEQMNQGLYVGPFVKSGASATANANGTTYYVVMNDALWVGRRSPPKASPVVEQTWCEPSCVWIGRAEISQAQQELHRRIGLVAAGRVSEANVRAIANSSRFIHDRLGGMGFRVLARVRHPKGPAAIKAVTVDASPLGAGRALAMLDDGKHGDGKPGDGVFAAEVRFDTSVFGYDHRTARRYGFPGRGALTVTAADKAGKADSWSAVASVHRQAEPIAFYGGGGAGHAFGEGPVSVRTARNEGLGHSGHALWFAATGPGPWSGATILHDRGGPIDINGRSRVTVYIKGDLNQDVRFHLVDRHAVGADVFDAPHLSHGVPLIGGGYLKAITPTYQKVVLPISALLPKGIYFLRSFAAGVALSVPKGGKPGNYYVAAVLLDP